MRKSIMKRVLTLFLATMCSASFLVCYAQSTAPNKEETMKFLSNTTQLAVGTPLDDGYYVVYTRFDNDSYTWQMAKTTDSRPPWVYFSANKIPWQEFESFLPNHKVDDQVTSIKLKFKTRVEHSIQMHTGQAQNRRDSFNNEVTIMVPTEKVESMKKAILRLVEIYKDENKSPF